MAASSVDTWNSLSASSTCAAVAKGSNRILASDSEILMIASSCLEGKDIILEHNSNAIKYSATSIFTNAVHSSMKGHWKFLGGGGGGS